MDYGDKGAAWPYMLKEICQGEKAPLSSLTSASSAESKMGGELQDKKARR